MLPGAFADILSLPPFRLYHFPLWEKELQSVFLQSVRLFLPVSSNRREMILSQNREPLALYDIKE